MLASAAGAGDAAAFAELYERHAPAIHGYCRRVLRSPEEAADATHEAFVSVLERLGDGTRPVLAPRAYLFRAAHNACVRIAAGRRRFVRGEPVGNGVANGGSLSEPERVVLTRELQEDVRRANGELALRQREVLALREVERLSYDEIARVMGITPNAAAQLAWRARANLRHRLRRRAFASITLQTLECQRALDLFELAEDSALSPEEDRWLAGHVVCCRRCAGNREVLAEVGATYRAWVPGGAAPLLTAALLHQAGHVVGAAWGSGAAAASAAGAGALAAPPSAFVATALGLAVAAGGVTLGGGAVAHHGRASAIAAVPAPMVAAVAHGRRPSFRPTGGRLAPLGTPPPPAATPASATLTAAPLAAQPAAAVAPAAPPVAPGPAQPPESGDQPAAAVDASPSAPAEPQPEESSPATAPEPAPAAPPAHVVAAAPSEPVPAAAPLVRVGVPVPAVERPALPAAPALPLPARAEHALTSPPAVPQLPLPDHAVPAVPALPALPLPLADRVVPAVPRLPLGP